MWLSGQQKRPADQSEGQSGIVTMSDGELAVLLDSERRGLELYAPGGYRWTPDPGQRVLVIQGRGEIPCVVGVQQGSNRPKQVTVEGDRLTISGNQVTAAGRQTAIQGGTVQINAEEKADIQAEELKLDAQVYIGDETLEEFILRVVAAAMAGGMFR